MNQRDIYTLIANPFECDLADFLIWRGIRVVPHLRGFITPQRRFCTLDAKEEDAYIDISDVNIEAHLNGWLLFKCEPERAWIYIDEMSERFGQYYYNGISDKKRVIEQRRDGRSYVDLYVYSYIKA
jgi:hypothetical protein